MDIPLSPCVPENLVSRDGFSRPVPRQSAHLHTQAESGAYLRDSSRVPYTGQKKNKYSTTSYILYLNYRTVSYKIPMTLVRFILAQHQVLDWETCGLDGKNMLF